MSNIVNCIEIIDRIFSTEGVTALMVQGAGTWERGEPSRVSDLDDAIAFNQRTAVHTMQAAGERRIIVRRHHGIIFAVEHPVGHPVAKSIERMLRRAAKRLAPPPATEAAGA